jgi:hypothetical protein
MYCPIESGTKVTELDFIFIIYLTVFWRLGKGQVDRHDVYMEEMRNILKKLRDHLGDLHIGRKIILKLILNM